MTSNVFKSVWDAIADTPEEAENLKARAALMHHIRARIEKDGLTQTKAAALYGVTQPRMSDLLRDRRVLLTVSCTVCPERASMTTSISRLNKSILPRNKSDMRGCVTP